MIRRMTLLIAAMSVVAGAGAHHSFEPHFDNKKPVSISGRVTRYEARNPHSYLHIQAEDENGRTQEYICESHGVTQLARNGITAAMLKPGTKLRVDGSQSRNDAHRCFFDNVYFPDGRALNVNGPRGTPASSGQSVAVGRKDIYGTWLLAPMPGRRTAGPQPMIQFITAAGKAAVAAYNPFKDDPAFRCDPVAVRRVWGAPGTPLSITREKDRVILGHEWMDVRRVVHLDQQAHPKGGKRTSLGHSIGHFEGDVLVIETGNFPAGVLNQYVEMPGEPTRGLLHSAALTTVERVRLDAARQRLVVEITMQDRDFFSRDFDAYTLEFGPSDLKLQPFNCARQGVNGLLK